MILLISYYSDVFRNILRIFLLRNGYGVKVNAPLDFASDGAFAVLIVARRGVEPLFSG